MRRVRKSAPIQKLLYKFREYRSKLRNIWIPRFVLLPLSHLIPKDRNRIVFVPRHHRDGFADNTRAVFEALRRNHPDIRVHCTRVPKPVRRRFPEFDRQMSQHLTDPRALCNVLRAGIVVTDNSLQHWMHEGNFRVAQLWHGTGFKRIEAMKGKPEIRDHADRLCFVLASSESDAERMRAAFGSPNVQITGAPRNDRLLDLARTAGPALRRQLGVGEAGRIFLYAPTLRWTPYFFENFQLSADFWRRADAILGSRGDVLIVKNHPRNRPLSLPGGLGHVRMAPEGGIDLEELLAVTDVLITDYSSIAVDFALLDRPILFYQNDYEAYVAHEDGFYGELREILPGPFLTDEAELLRAMADLDWFDTPEHRHAFDAFVARFHHYRDGASAGRVAAALRALL